MISGSSFVFVEEFLLEAPNQYKFLSNGNLQVQGINDAQEYSDTMVCFDWLLTYDVQPFCFIGSNVYYGNDR